MLSIVKPCLKTPIDSSGELPVWSRTLLTNLCHNWSSLQVGPVSTLARPEATALSHPDVRDFPAQAQPASKAKAGNWEQGICCWKKKNDFKGRFMSLWLFIWEKSHAQRCSFSYPGDMDCSLRSYQAKVRKGKLKSRARSQNLPGLGLVLHRNLKKKPWTRTIWKYEAWFSSKLWLFFSSSFFSHLLPGEDDPIEFRQVNPKKIHSAGWTRYEKYKAW